jgi:hypothetical protein
MDFCKNCGLILIWEEQIGPHLKKVGKIGLTKVFLSSNGFLARKVDEELQKLDANEPYYQAKRKSLLVQLLYYNVKSINKKYGLLTD